jgi:hypothetical protein
VCLCVCVCVCVCVCAHVCVLCVLFVCVLCSRVCLYVCVCVYACLLWACVRLHGNLGVYCDFKERNAHYRILGFVHQWHLL